MSGRLNSHSCIFTQNTSTPQRLSITHQALACYKLAVLRNRVLRFMPVYKVRFCSATLDAGVQSYQTQAFSHSGRRHSVTLNTSVHSYWNYLHSNIYIFLEHNSMPLD